MAHSEDITKWSEAIERGIKYKEDYGESKRWATYKDYYRGKFAAFDGTTDGGILPYNITYTIARSLIPNLYFRDPYINVTTRPTMGGQVRMDYHARIVQAIDNLLIQEMGVKKQIKTSLLDCYFTNRAIWKLGYDSEFGFKPADIDPTLNATTTSVNNKGENIEYNTNVAPGAPWVLRVDPNDIVVPFGVRTLDESPWIAHRILRPLADLKQDKKYINTSDLEGTHLGSLLKNNTHRGNFFQELIQNMAWVEMWEIRDRRTQTVSVIVPSHDKYIRPPQHDILQVDGLPYVDLTFNEDPDYYWGPSDCTIIEPQQLEINEARTQAMYHRRVALVKFLVEENMIDDGEIAKMLSGEVGPCVKVKGDPKQAVATIQPHIPQEFQMWVDSIRQDVREMVGFSRADSGAIPQGRRTATEVNIGQAGKELRLDERRDMVVDALTSIMRKTNQIVFTLWGGKKVAQVVGLDGAKYWVEHTAEQIKGEYGIKIDAENMSPITKKIKRKELTELVGMLIQNPRANVDYLIKQLLREYDWLDAMAILPEAQENDDGKAIPAEQYGEVQKNIQNNKGFREARVNRTQGLLGGLQ